MTSKNTSHIDTKMVKWNPKPYIWHCSTQNSHLAKFFSLKVPEVLTCESYERVYVAMGKAEGSCCKGIGDINVDWGVIGYNKNVSIIMVYWCLLWNKKLQLAVITEEGMVNNGFALSRSTKSDLLLLKALMIPQMRVTVKCRQGDYYITWATSGELLLFIIS